MKYGVYKARSRRDREQGESKDRTRLPDPAVPAFSGGGPLNETGNQGKRTYWFVSLSERLYHFLPRRHYG